ncbi:YceI family protein [Leptospira gomenensis]|uniref:YceI family protein n=1 Tax=Leptospira gomenensis TaxID=2484974 RepID=A0A5F1Z0P8_9LEPT|nr:YceI family protein [Leptospira gomenensis]TGK28998.1 YceI family protein [Leptospira gomenensis]TGK32821.1 YceI family protein [Leptospira gomenensis]TGK51898.1 YceI family protein [Leptospira gomenensis]TGK67294.1 YceI family protein [Leptospira gomenensis]
MKRSIVFYTLILLPFVAGFSQSSDKNQTCTYSYEHASTKFEWKAFKFTEKTGVAGSFDTITTFGTKPASSPEKVFVGMKFRIDPNTIQSGNPERDGKIKGSFFYPLKKNGTIEGKVVSVELNSDKNGGKGAIQLSFNGITKNLDVNFSLKEGSVLEAKAVLNLGEWKALSAVEALNHVCKELHKGKDGVSKLWPEVELNISTKLKTNCP